MRRHWIVVSLAVLSLFGTDLHAKKARRLAPQMALLTEDVDTPFVKVQKPADNATITGTTIFYVKVTGTTPISSVTLAVDGVGMGTLSLSNGNYIISVDSTKLTNGLHSFKFTGMNTGGKSMTASMKITVANVALDTPFVKVQKPPNNATISGTVPFYVKVTGITPISSVVLTVDDVSVGSLVLSGDNYIISVDSTKFVNGLHTFKFIGTNTGGKSMTATMKITTDNVVLIDTPFAKVQKPADNATITGTVPFYVKVTGTTPISTVTLLVDSIPMGNLTLSNGNYVIDVDSTLLTNGLHSFKFVATNIGGKSMTASMKINVANTITIDSPHIQVLRPENNQTVNGNIAFYLDVTGTTPISSVVMFIDSVLIGGLVPWEGNYVVGLDTTRLTNGFHNIQFVARNSQAQSTTASIGINVQNIYSTPPMFVNAGGSYVDTEGHQWIEDTGLYERSTGTVMTELPYDNLVYQTARYGDYLEYSFNVPNGNYNVTLKFAELVYRETGKRIFNGYINGIQAVFDFDIYGIVGAYGDPYGGQCDITTPVTVNNGKIVINLNGIVDKAQVNGISIVPLF